LLLLLLPPPLLLLLLLLLATQVDSDRCRILPDGSRWVVDLWGAAADMALGSKPYSWKKGMARKGGSSFKWLIPVVAYGQVRAMNDDINHTNNQKGRQKRRIVTLGM
jgi:hypothetical protein